MKEYTNIIYTNIMNYRVSDDDCRKLIYEAKYHGISEILLSPASLEPMKELLMDYQGQKGVSVSYPAGACYPENKVYEMKTLLERFPWIDAFYAVPAMGRFLSGKIEESREEVRMLAKAAQGRRLYLLLETASLTSEQIGQYAEFARESAVTGLAVGIGFGQYELPLPTTETVRQVADCCGKQLEVIAPSMKGCGYTAEELFAAGADRIFMSELN